MKKKIFEAAVIGTILFSYGAMAAQAKTLPKCGATGGTNIGISNTNVLIAGQYSSATNISGWNGLFGNIGPITLITGTSSSTSTQTISGNTTTNTINLTGGGATNTTNISNTGNGVTICTSAAN